MQTKMTISRIATLALAVLALGAALTPPSLAQTSEVKLDRTSLPIPEPDYPRSTVLDARDAKAPARFEIKAPAGAPNVLIVLVDEMGFGMPSAFGGPVRMPNAEGAESSAGASPRPAGAFPSWQAGRVAALSGL